MGIEKALLTWVVLSTVLAPLHAAKCLANRIGGGPVGFLSKEKRKIITSDKRISHINPNGILGDVIVITKEKYSTFDSIEIKVFPNEKEKTICVSEAGIFHNVSTVFGKRRGNENGGVLPVGSSNVLKKNGCVYERGSVTTYIKGDYTAEMILEAVCRVATTCKEISEIDTVEWERQS